MPKVRIKQAASIRTSGNTLAQGTTPLVDVPLACRLLLFSALLTVAACKPPASDDYLERVDLAEARGAVGEPLPSPDTTNAVWANSKSADRILYGNPGETPFLALECERAGGVAQIKFTRFAAANAQAKALFALVGNGHIARIPVDAEWNGRAWLWEGAMPADEPDLEVLTGKRIVAATLPGAGQLDLNPSPLPGELIEACRAKSEPAPELPESS
ncbi:MAG: hypothetical protein WBA55_05830 [Allopontixanthobacter sediminis]